MVAECETVHKNNSAISNKWGNSTKMTPIRQKGFSLVEMMISMTIGLTLVAGVSSIFSNTLKSSSDFVATAKLDQDLTAVLEFISKEVRRAGYDGGAAGGTDTAFGIDDVASGISSSTSTSSCLIYTFDMDGDGALDSNEQNGIRLNSGNTAVMFKQSVTSCSDITSGAINDDNTIVINSLEFEHNRLCVNLTDSSNCMENTSGYQAPNSGDLKVWKREITITLSGYYKNDPDQYSRTVSNTIRLHNDILETH